MEFRRGDVINYGGREAVLNYTNAEAISRSNDVIRWGVRFIDNGGDLAWVTPNEKDYIRHEEDDIFDKMDATKRNRIKQESDLVYIKNNVLTNNEMSFTSLLKLYDEVGFETPFYKNGVWDQLIFEYSGFYPIFKAMFEGRYEEMVDRIEGKFKHNFIDKYKESFTKLYLKVQNI